MIAPKLISDLIPPLHLDDTGEHVLMLMQEYNVNQLPVLDGRKYVGIITMDEVINLKHLSNPLKNFQLPLKRPFVINTSHIFDVMKAAVDFNVKVVPVINDSNDYLGLISAESCLRAFAVMNSIKDSGAIIEVDIPLNDYSLTEVARIVEDSDAHVLCLYTNIRQEESMVELTLKVDTTEVGGIVGAFERYEYEVKNIYNDTAYTVELKDRYDALMRFLNV